MMVRKRPLHRTPNHATVGDFRVVDFSIKAGAQPRGFPRAASRSRWRDGLLPALCLGWPQQVGDAAETSREPIYAELQSRTDPNDARGPG
jgi:hypothetical protein